MAVREDYRSMVPFARRWHVIAEIDLMRIVAEHAAIEHLCKRLESIADTLPERPSPGAVVIVTEELEELLGAHNSHEDQVLEAMFARDLPRLLTHSLLDHIHARHISCAVQAQDLSAALMAGAEGEHAVPAETLGYMLRCFFEGCRDAMAFEQLAILALAGNRLTDGARALMTERMAQTCRTV
ncbi:hypothetical protein [uncultured Sphingomonas sp.]|uniref:hypothetical protein n=1 Tax=uncultured Sphingomonas sp. TaxID=158754 RepID=UPI0025D92852|nr:hypothetical protein [uncultured Sphingomonas sp.]